MTTFLKRAAQYILFWVFLILILEVAGFTFNTLFDDNRKIPALVLVFAIIGAFMVSALLCRLYRKIYKSLR